MNNLYFAIELVIPGSYIKHDARVLMSKIFYMSAQSTSKYAEHQKAYYLNMRIIYKSVHKITVMNISL